MSDWRHIQIQANCIEADTFNGVLINLPKNSRYKGYSFWHPRKLCRSVGKNGWLLQISFTDEFIFHIKKYGKGQYNYKQVLDEKELDADEIMTAFGFGNEAEYENLDDLKDDD